MLHIRLLHSRQEQLKLGRVVPIMMEGESFRRIRRQKCQ